MGTAAIPTSIWLLGGRGEKLQGERTSSLVPLSAPAVPPNCRLDFRLRIRSSLASFQFAPRVASHLRGAAWEGALLPAAPAAPRGHNRAGVRRRSGAFTLETLRSVISCSKARVSSACFWLCSAIFSLNFRGLEPPVPGEPDIVRAAAFPKPQLLRTKQRAVLGLHSLPCCSEPIGGLNTQSITRCYDRTREAL